MGEWSAARPGLLYPRGRPVPIVQEVRWPPGPDRTGEESRPTGIRSPDRPARSLVAIPTELPGPYVYHVIVQLILS